MTSFGPMLKDLRTQIGLSQAELAARLGSTQRHVSFLETGRSAPTHGFLQRICRELNLGEPQQANLFDACGWRSRLKPEDFSTDDIAAALDMLEKRVLRVWPFPAVVLDGRWNIVRRNAPFDRLFAPLLSSSNIAPNLMAIFLSPTFRALVTNWPEVAPAIYFRLQSAAAQDANLAALFDQARKGGVFDGFDPTQPANRPASVYVPIRLTFPNGISVNTSSLMAQLAAVHDALVDGFEVELILPIDDASEQKLRDMLSD